jgi:FKBP-type peptidyl-prolyl cis-trans isomerase FkpA
MAAGHDHDPLATRPRPWRVALRRGAAARFAATPAPAAPAIIKLPLQPVVSASMRACSLKTASGLGYTVLQQGTGPKAGKSDFVLINYIRYLAATGAVFDQNMTTPLNLDNVIPGFAEGVQLMARGSIYRLCVPAALGYGAAGAGRIRPSQFRPRVQIELVDSRQSRK